MTSKAARSKQKQLSIYLPQECIDWLDSALNRSAAVRWLIEYCMRHNIIPWAGQTKKSAPESEGAGTD